MYWFLYYQSSYTSRYFHSGYFSPSVKVAYIHMGSLWKNSDHVFSIFRRIFYINYTGAYELFLLWKNRRKREAGIRCSYSGTGFFRFPKEPARTKHNLTPYSCFQTQSISVGADDFPAGSYIMPLELTSGIIELDLRQNTLAKVVYILSAIYFSKLIFGSDVKWRQ